MVDSTRRVKICDAPELKDKCANFVHLVDNTMGSFGDAWTAWPKNEMPGKTKKWSVMSSLSDEHKKTYDELVSSIKGIGEKNGPFNPSAKELHKKIIDDSSSVNKTILKPGSIVGIFWPPSGYHEAALKRSSKWEKYAPFNTHVGIVIAVKDDVPIILHEFGGVGSADPFDNLTNDAKIVWVAQDNSWSKWQIAADNVLDKVIRGAQSTASNLADMMPSWLPK